MTVGQAYAVSVTMENNGTTTWTEPAYYLRAQPHGNLTWTPDRTALSPGESIGVGQRKTFAWTVTAPATPGTYDFQWRMRQSGVNYFGDMTLNAAVTVVAAPPPTRSNAARFVSQNVPPGMAAGQTYTVSLTFGNVGTTTWSEAGQYRLSSRRPRDNSTWGVNRVYLASPVAPGQTTTFTFDVTAPATPGVYDFAWSMVEDAAQDWFDEVSPVVSFNITGAAPAGGGSGRNGENGNGDGSINDKCGGSIPAIGTGSMMWVALALAAFCGLLRRKP